VGWARSLSSGALDIDVLADEWDRWQRSAAAASTINTSEATTQTERRPTNSTATDGPPIPPACTYAAAAVETPQESGKRRQQAEPQGARRDLVTPQRETKRTPPAQQKGHQAAPQRRNAETERPKQQVPPRGDRRAPPLTTRAVVMHAAPLKWKTSLTKGTTKFIARLCW